MATSTDPLAEAIAAHDEASIFRSSFRYRFTRPEDQAALDRLGLWALEFWTETDHFWPALPESAIRHEVLAAREDLAATAAFLDVIRLEPSASALDHPADHILTLGAHSALAHLHHALKILDAALDGRLPVDLDDTPQTPHFEPPPERPRATTVAVFALLGGAALWWMAARR